MNTEHQDANRQSGKSENNKEGTAPTTERLADVAHDVVDKAAARTADVERAARHNAERAREKAYETASTAQQTSQTAMRTVTEYTQQNPLSALGTAFAAGIMLSALLRR